MNDSKVSGPAAMSPGIAQWEQRFASTDDYVYGTEPNRFMVSKAGLLKPGMKVLALADGEGRNGVWLAGQGLEVVSMDGSIAAQKKARSLAEAHGVQLEFVCDDLARWDFGSNQFDAIVAIFIQFCKPELRRHIFTQAIAALKPGGYLLLQGYRTEQLRYKTGGPSAIENLYTEEQLRSELAGLEMVSIESHDSEMNEGVGHKGLSAVIDVVARKPVSA